MAKLIQTRPYWEYDYQEEAIIVRDPIRGNSDGDEHLGWGYIWKPKVGERVRIVSNRDSDHELCIEPLDSDGSNYYIWDQCVEPANKPIPDDVDLTDPQGIEQFLGG